LFGAAKPVPYNPYNFNKWQKWGEAFVAFAGQAANIGLAIIFAMLVRFADVLALSDTFVGLAVSIIMLNIFLAFFNLVPIPPLDGSKILPRLLPRSIARGYDQFRAYFEQNVLLGFGLVILLFIFVFSEPIFIASVYLASFFSGLGIQEILVTLSSFY
jgi:Zn-dependent protease